MPPVKETSSDAAGDANHKNGVWLWAAIDNLRVAALTAVECAETLTASRPRGQIQ